MIIYPDLYPDIASNKCYHKADKCWIIRSIIYHWWNSSHLLTIAKHIFAPPSSPFRAHHSQRYFKPSFLPSSQILKASLRLSRLFISFLKLLLPRTHGG